jgi:hypothetical protein
VRGTQLYSRSEESPTSRDVTVRGIDKPEGSRETKLGRGIGGVRGSENPVYDVSLEGALDDTKRGVMVVIHEKDRKVGTDRKTEALDERRNVAKQDTV